MQMKSEEKCETFAERNVKVLWMKSERKVNKSVNELWKVSSFTHFQGPSLKGRNFRETPAHSMFPSADIFQNSKIAQNQSLKFRGEKSPLFVRRQVQKVKVL